MDTVEHDMPKSEVAWFNVIASRCEKRLAMLAIFYRFNDYDCRSRQAIPSLRVRAVAKLETVVG